MDAESLGPERAALQRSRLHLRSARRRLRQGKISAGLAALYDSLTCGMDWFLASPGSRARAGLSAPTPRDDGPTFSLLVRAGVLGGGFDFDDFQRLVYRGLDEALPDVDHAAVLSGVEATLAQLGVLPFDESELPPEDPNTI